MKQITVNTDGNPRVSIVMDDVTIDDVFNTVNFYQWVFLYMTIEAERNWFRATGCLDSELL